MVVLVVKMNDIPKRESVLLLVYTNDCILHIMLMMTGSECIGQCRLCVCGGLGNANKQTNQNLSKSKSQTLTEKNIYT